jgi:hypothetical protein
MPDFLPTLKFIVTPTNWVIFSSKPNVMGKTTATYLVVDLCQFWKNWRHHLLLFKTIRYMTYTSYMWTRFYLYMFVCVACVMFYSIKINHVSTRHILRLTIIRNIFT